MQALTRRNYMILSLRHLPMIQIAEQLEKAGMPAGLGAIRHVLRDNGIRPVIDEELRSAKLRAAAMRQKESRKGMAMAGLEKAAKALERQRITEALPTEPVDRGSQLVATLTPSQLEHARKILGATGDITRAAAAVSMDPVRLRRHINNAR